MFHYEGTKNLRINSSIFFVFTVTFPKECFFKITQILFRD